MKRGETFEPNKRVGGGKLIKKKKKKNPLICVGEQKNMLGTYWEHIGNIVDNIMGRSMHEEHHHPSRMLELKEQH